MTRLATNRLATNRVSSPYGPRGHALAELVREDGAIDWSPWYLTEEEDMGQSPEQDLIIDVLKSSLEVLARERNWQSVLVGADHFFAWVEGQPLVQVSPDVFLLDHPPGPDEWLPRRWETWRPGHNPPRFAVEIVSLEWKKDYELNPVRYDHLGVKELVIADPAAAIENLGSRGRAPFQVYRRIPGAETGSRDDRLVLAECDRGPVYCAEIDAYLIFQQPTAGRITVRVARDREGCDIVPTASEEARAAQREARAAQRDAQAARRDARAARRDARAARKLVAEQAAEIEALRAQLSKLQDS